MDIDKLKALHEAATPELKTVSPRIMAQLLRLGGEHQHPRAKDWESAKYDADGLLISTLLDAVPEIIAQSERLARYEEMLRGVSRFLNDAPAESGVCCCGSPMDGHGYWDGHNPTDQFSYSAGQWVSEIRQALGEDK